MKTCSSNKNTIGSTRMTRKKKNQRLRREKNAEKGQDRDESKKITKLRIPRNSKALFLFPPSERILVQLLTSMAFFAFTTWSFPLPHVAFVRGPPAVKQECKLIRWYARSWTMDTRMADYPWLLFLRQFWTPTLLFAFEWIKKNVSTCVL